VSHPAGRPAGRDSPRKPLHLGEGTSTGTWKLRRSGPGWDHGGDAMDLEGDTSPWETRAMDRWQRRFLATDSSAEQGLEVGRSPWRAVDRRARQRAEREAATHSRANDGENRTGFGRYAMHPIPQALFGDVGVRASGSEPHRTPGRRSSGSGIPSGTPRVALAWEVGRWLATLSAAAGTRPASADPALRPRCPRQLRLPPDSVPGHPLAAASATATSEPASAGPESEPASAGPER